MARLRLLLTLALAIGACRSDPATQGTTTTVSVVSDKSGPKSCTSSADCGRDGRCTTDDGVCDPPAGCTPEFPCPQVCTGTCVAKPVAAKVSSACSSDADCRSYSSRCHGCACLALGKDAPDPSCDEDPVMCLIEPCQGRKAICKEGTCAIIGSPANPAK
jgi:hypothetical protein